MFNKCQKVWFLFSFWKWSEGIFLTRSQSLLTFAQRWLVILQNWHRRNQRDLSVLTQKVRWLAVVLTILLRNKFSIFSCSHANFFAASNQSCAFIIRKAQTPLGRHNNSRGSKANKFHYLPTGIWIEESGVRENIHTEPVKNHYIVILSIFWLVTYVCIYTHALLTPQYRHIYSFCEI